MYLLVMNIITTTLAFIVPGGLLLLSIIRAKRKRTKKEKAKPKKEVLDIKMLKRMQRFYFADKYRKRKRERKNYE